MKKHLTRLFAYSTVVLAAAVAWRIVEVEAQQSAYLRVDNPYALGPVRVPLYTRVDAGVLSPSNTAWGGEGRIAGNTVTHRPLYNRGDAGWIDVCVSGDDCVSGARADGGGELWRRADGGVLVPTADSGAGPVQVGGTSITTAVDTINAVKSSAGAATGFYGCENTSTSATAGKGCDYSFRMTDGSGNHVEQARIWTTLDPLASNPNTATNTSSVIRFGTRSLGTFAERAQFTSTGQLLVGTTTPANSAVGIIEARADRNERTNIIVTNSTDGTNAWAELSCGSTLVGYFGMAYMAASYVGAATPEDVAIGGNVGLLRTDDGITGGIILDTAASAPLRFFTNKTEKSRIYSTGGMVLGMSATDLGAGKLNTSNGVFKNGVEYGTGTTSLSGMTTNGVLYATAATTAASTAAGTTGQCFIGNTGSPPSWGSCAGSGVIAGSIATTQVAFGSGTNTIAGDADFNWDNTLKKLAVGTTTISTDSRLTVRKDQNAGTSYDVVNATNGTAAAAYFYASNGSEGLVNEYVPAASTLLSGVTDAGIIRSDSTVSGGLVLDAAGGNIKLMTTDLLRGTVSSTGLAMTGQVTATTKVGAGATAPDYIIHGVGTGASLAGNAKLVIQANQDQTTYRGAGLGYDSTGQIGVLVSNTASAASILAFWVYTGSAFAEQARIASTTGLSMTSRRLEEAKGANVASGTTVTLGTDGNLFHITGTTTIKGFVTTNWQSGSCMHLIFDGILTVTHQSGAPGASAVDFWLKGAVNRTTAANDTMEVCYDGVYWYEF